MVLVLHHFPAFSNYVKVSIMCNLRYLNSASHCLNDFSYGAYGLLCIACLVVPVESPHAEILNNSYSLDAKRGRNGLLENCFSIIVNPKESLSVCIPFEAIGDNRGSYKSASCSFRRFLGFLNSEKPLLTSLKEHRLDLDLCASCIAHSFSQSNSFIAWNICQ